MDNEKEVKPTELTIVDLQNIRAILDVAARRGAFGGAELTAVGTVYNKLDSFLKAVEKTENSAENKEENKGAV